MTIARSQGISKDYSLEIAVPHNSVDYSVKANYPAAWLYIENTPYAYGMTIQCDLAGCSIKFDSASKTAKTLDANVEVLIKEEWHTDILITNPSGATAANFRIRLI